MSSPEVMPTDVSGALKGRSRKFGGGPYFNRYTFGFS